MKIHSLLIVVFVMSILSLITVSGCKYDVAEPVWENSEFTLPGRNPAINSINPPQGVPGANIIEILGQNFDLVPNSNIFLQTPTLFGISPEIVQKTATSISIRRPNLITDSLFVKVWGDSGLVENFGPYRIDPVFELYGSFFENHTLGAIAADNSGNVYIAEAVAPFPIIKILPGGNQTVLVDTLPTATPLTASSTPSEAVIGPDGFLYLLRVNRIIQKVNTETGEVTNWHRYEPSSRNQLRYGDFDENGYLYAGGGRTDLVIIAPDSSSRTSGMYSTSSDTIYAITVSNNFLYLSVGGETGRAVWRHTIDGSGNLGSKELVFDPSADSRFSLRNVTAIKFSQDGKMYLATDSPVDPLLVSENGNVDYLYKNILPPYFKKAAGLNNYLYLISGNLTPAQNWMVYRVDVGTNLAP